MQRLRTDRADESLSAFRLAMPCTHRVRARLRTDRADESLITQVRFRATFGSCGARSCMLHQLLPTKFSIINVKLSKTKLETLRLLLLAVGSYPRARATRAACMEKIYEIPCAWAAWDLCAGSLFVKSTVLLLSVF